ncbi:MAG: FG-GAP-like repeat-containing protein [Gammaproteobacteria bacterium]
MKTDMKNTQGQFAPVRARMTLAVVVIALALLSCDRGQMQLTERDIADNNRGVALMGSFDYPAARNTFATLFERRPDWADAGVNLAIATLNRQQEGDEQLALDILEQVLAEDPDNLRALFVGGLLFLYQGETELSLEALRKVSEADPGDAYAAYFIAQNLMQKGQLEEALNWYRKSLEADAYLRSSYYGAALALRRLDRRDDARSMLNTYDRLKDNPRARLAEFKYTRMGPRATALAVGKRSISPVPPVDGPLFGEPVDTELAEPGAPRSNLTIADIDGDGVLDIFVSSLAGSSLLLGNTSGEFSEQSDHPLAGITDVKAAAWGDIDNDGRNDVYLCRRGPNQLWLQQSEGGWRNVARAMEVDDDADCADVGILDADHDGDLDLFVVNEDGPDELFNNNRDGSFRRLASQQGIAGTARGRQFLPADLDGDRDVDLIVINDEQPNEIWINDRLWSYRAADNASEFRSANLLAATAGDLDADGRVEIYAASPDGQIAVWDPSAETGWTRDLLTQFASGGGVDLAIADVDGDGNQDLLASVDQGVYVVRQGEHHEIISREGESPFAAQPVNMNPGNGPSLIALARDGSVVRHWPPGPGRFEFLAIEPSGKEDQAESMRSNRSGIGTRIALRNLDHWTISWFFDNHSGPGQSLQPVSIGLGGRPVADFVALDWSDGVFQTELDLDAGRLHRIAETQRQLSSCPVLFAWDGEQFRFVSDLLGVGGLGFLVSPGTYSTPRPWEFFLLPPELSVPRNDRYAVKITEPMEENAYLDSMRLHVIDLPREWSVVPDERMATGAPAVTGRPIFFRQELLPTKAMNDRQEDVSQWVLDADQLAAPVGRLDARFIGRLEQTHTITLEFGQVVNPPGGHPVLVADGWVEYPYSQTVFAAWQAGETYQPTSLEARTADGVWHMVYPGFGYPAGMPRTMTLPLEMLPPGTDALRLSTNLEVYWDRLRIVYEDTPPDVRKELATPVLARLTKIGFPKRTTGAQRLPGYDYEIRKAFWDARYLDGEYTRLGPVEELLANTDDAVVVMGSGEEVHVEFPAPATAPPPGWTRQLILETRGWAKDMDLFTRDGGQVGPLPRREQGASHEEARRAELHDLYNTRFQGGR